MFSLLHMRLSQEKETTLCCDEGGGLDGQHRAIVIAESLARVIAAIRITSVRWRSYPSPPPPKKTQNLGLINPAFVALQCESQQIKDHPHPQ